MSRPLLITMGDPAGIGPEIVARAFALGQAEDAVVVGCPKVLARAARLLPESPVVRAVAGLAEAERLPAGVLPVLAPAGLPAGLESLAWGRVHAGAGLAAARCIEEAVARIQAGQAQALVTAPLHKEALAAAGIDHPGHTEMLQALAARGGEPAAVRMMLANDELRVVLVTIHLSLRRAIEALSRESVLQTIRIAHAAVQTHLGRAPRIAVAGLNPHAGEGGLFGDEELTLIGPAIEAARAEGIDASGPHPPDTVFMRARHAAGHPGAFDVVVAMTHDHGLIPVKYLGVEHGVNVTLGLPFVRTSPDHGTAFDIAGQGCADPSSLLAALRQARRLAGLPGSARLAGHPDRLGEGGRGGLG